MRSIAWSIFLIFASSTHASEANNDLQVIEKLNSICQIDLGKKINHNIISAEAESIKIEFGNYLSFKIQTEIKNKSRKLRFDVSLSCPLPNSRENKNPSDSMSPRELMVQEDAGGRYFKHVKWQKDVAGLNWKGKAAYADYILGDGITSFASSYLICPAVKENFCVKIDIKHPTKPTSLEQLFFWNLIQEFKYLG